VEQPPSRNFESGETPKLSMENEQLHEISERIGSFGLKYNLINRDIF
jgi:hypothetical protein